MATIAEMQNKMTVYYRLENGAIKQIIGGIQDMSVFGDEQNDFIKIWGYIVLDMDAYVINNSQNFVYDLESNQLKIKQDTLPKYPVA
jgi:hypothetical protein